MLQWHKYKTTNLFLIDNVICHWSLEDFNKPSTGQVIFYFRKQVTYSLHILTSKAEPRCCITSSQKNVTVTLICETDDNRLHISYYCHFSDLRFGGCWRSVKRSKRTFAQKHTHVTDCFCPHRPRPSLSDSQHHWQPGDAVINRRINPSLNDPKVGRPSYFLNGYSGRLQSLAHADPIQRTKTTCFLLAAVIYYTEGYGLLVE